MLPMGECRQFQCCSRQLRPQRAGRPLSQCAAKMAAFPVSALPRWRRLRRFAIYGVISERAGMSASKYLRSSTCGESVPS